VVRLSLGDDRFARVDPSLRTHEAAQLRAASARAHAFLAPAAGISESREVDQDLPRQSPAKATLGHAIVTRAPEPAGKPDVEGFCTLHGCARWCIAAVARHSLH